MRTPVGIDGNSQPVGKIFKTELKINSVSRNKFSIMRQSSATNKLAMMKTTNSDEADKNDNVVIENGNLSVTLENFSQLSSGIKATTHRLIDAIMIRCTESGAKENVVTLALEDYMEMCGLKNLKETRKQVNAELKTLLNMKLTFSRSSSREQSFNDIKLCDSACIKNNRIIFSFSEDFFRILKYMPVMPYPMKLFNINHKKNPNSYYFLKKISEHKKMNYFKKNADTISVKTLLECTPELPKYDDVMSGDRAVARRIIEPFERDLNDLSEVFRWEYCHTNGTRLFDHELDNFDYHVFYSLMIKVKWKEYPELQKKTTRKKAGAV